MTVTESTSEISTATDSVSDSARKNWPTTPDSSPSGANTTTVVSVELTSGATSSRDGVARRSSAPFAGAAMDVLDHDDRVVDDQADGDRQAAHRHQVDRLAEQPHEHERRDDRQRQRDGRDSVSRQLRRKTSSTRTASRPPIRIASRTLAMASRDELGEVVDLGDA